MQLYKYLQWQMREGIIAKIHNCTNEGLSYIKIHFTLVQNVYGGIQTKGIWKQKPKENVWAQEGWELGAE